ncbi:MULTISPECIES: hypothetical protein [unclassified Neochlamydia]|uniref:hypothetical protein n=1 Tax=unclassified Neochlamydia TaxID=2643326 RepID=UPI001409B275|nr:MULTISPECIES: hypothetical protein [unclassified Neochlamydia]MBS4171292.1 hypothetical protein [Neochlamydia sp. AcF95]NGY94317.1 hypothetical protein [Neochlamydia sp. AcF84]
MSCLERFPSLLSLPWEIEKNMLDSFSFLVAQSSRIAKHYASSIAEFAFILSRKERPRRMREEIGIADFIDQAVGS